VGRGAHFSIFDDTMADANTRQTIEAQAQALCEPLIAAEGLELLDLEYVREQGGWILRLFIDLPAGVVGVEECARASHAVDRALDVEDFIPTGYALEIASDGVVVEVEGAGPFRIAFKDIAKAHLQFEP